MSARAHPAAEQQQQEDGVSAAAGPQRGPVGVGEPEVFCSWTCSGSVHTCAAQQREHHLTLRF